MLRFICKDCGRDFEDIPDNNVRCPSCGSENVKSISLLYYRT